MDAQFKQAQLQQKAQKDLVDSALEAEKLKIDQQELQLDAQKEGVKLAADRRKDNTKLDLELAKMMTGKNNRS
jgi:hypothetical protein